jgi:type VI secretion system secreted protein Hcp
MPFDTFAKIEGVDGEATRAGHEGEIEILSFSWGASNPTSVSAGTTGLSASRVSISSFNIMKGTDLASASLFLKCCKGAHIPKIVVTMNTAGGEKQMDYLTYEFQDCMVESIQWSGSSGGDDRPTESVSFAFAKVEITYNQQAITGGKGKPIVVAYDQTTRT